MTKKKTDEEFKQEVYNSVGDEYIFLDKYVNAITKLKVKHNKCGNVYEVAPNNFLNGKRCPSCMANQSIKKRTKTTEQFKAEVSNLVGDEYSVLGKYKGNKAKIKVRHNKCGNVYEVAPSSFLYGNRCPKCNGTFKKTTKQFKDEVYSLVKDEYSVLGEYKGTDTKIEIRHNKCNYEYKVTPYNFLKGSHCPKCNNLKMHHSKAKTYEEFEKELYDLVGDEYKLVSKYYNAKTKVTLLHKTCGETYSVTPTSFLSKGNRCNCTKNNKGEEKIADYLINHDISYYREKTFPWLKYKTNGNQRLDFYLPDYKLVIEYDGVQHYKLINWTGDLTLDEQEQNLKDNQLRDKNKNGLLKEHGIKLIRIPYYKFNEIDSILDKEVKIK